MTLLARLLLCLMALCPLAGAHAGAPAALEQLNAQLEQANTLHARFAQTKTLQALKRPLRTSGRLVFTRQQGLLWLIEKPYQASYALTPEQVVEIAPDGARKTRATREAPALAQMGKVFQALFQGRMDVLEEHFEVTASAEAGHWRVDLAPKPALARYLKGISAHGGRFLDLIELQEAQGDRTRIEFHDTRVNAPLSETDQRLLKP